MSTHDITDEEVAQACAGAPAWIKPELVRNTLTTLQPFYAEKLTADECVEILIRMGQLFRILDADPKDRH